MSEKLYGILLQEAIPTPDKPQKIRNLVVNKEAKELIAKQNKEIERLNNIINELEEWLKYKKEQMEEFEIYKRKETGAFWWSTMGNIDTFLDEIKELKENK